MKIERDIQGDFIVAPDDLANRFGLSGADLRLKLKRGLVKSRVETGQAEDAGNFRLTVRIGNRIWLAILDADGRLVRETGPLHGRAGTHVQD